MQHAVLTPTFVPQPQPQTTATQHTLALRCTGASMVCRLMQQREQSRSTKASESDNTAHRTPHTAHRTPRPSIPRMFSRCGSLLLLFLLSPSAADVRSTLMTSSHSQGLLWGVFSILFVTVCIGTTLTRQISFPDIDDFGTGCVVLLALASFLLCARSLALSHGLLSLLSSLSLRAH